MTSRPAPVRVITAGGQVAHYASADKLNGSRRCDLGHVHDDGSVFVWCGRTINVAGRDEAGDLPTCQSCAKDLDRWLEIARAAVMQAERELARAREYLARLEAIE